VTISQFFVLTTMTLGILAIILAIGKLEGSRTLAVILLVAALTRAVVGAINVYWGPLPGAEIDAVLYDGLATSYADQLVTTGHPVIQFGRFGYSTLLSFFYAIDGRNIAIPTLVNIYFVVFWLVCVYRLIREVTDKGRALQATALAAIYPTCMLYTAVPLREAPLMTGLGLTILTLVRWWTHRGSLFTWQMLLGIVLLVWLHSGFIFLPVFFGMLFWYRQVKGQYPTVAALRTTAVGILGLGAGIMFLKLGGLLPKLPADPLDIFSLQFLANFRSYKASYGTGYLGFVPSSWLGMIAFVPLATIAFLFSPTPLDLIQGGGFSDLVKFADSALFFVMVILSVRGWRRTTDPARRDIAGLLLLLFLFLAFVFAMGTANMGIAIRHRAKFAWILITVIALTMRRDSEDASPDPSDPKP
jgi:hypothetical protein